MKTAFSGLRKRHGRNLCFRLETFGDFYRFVTPAILQNTTGCPRSGKSRENFLSPLRSAVTGIRPPDARRQMYIRFATFSASRHRPSWAGRAGTLDTPGFGSRWPALCVSVGTAVDDVTTGRFQEQTTETGLGITRGKNDRSASGNTQLQVDEPRKPSSASQ
ncbi:hypothetical protein [Burkholderia stabilis]|uniref:hypothetical protein n=1 Tax=Burkholderia stabilis TaxID=95485 RepID=UPI001F4A53D6|nr:hypothetical protein [Burkholderia stabilis]